MGGAGAEVLPVIAVVTDEFHDLAEGLICDDTCERHDDDD